MQPSLRLELCALICLAPAAPLVAKLVKLQVLEHRGFRHRVETRTGRRALEIVPRGRILDREGKVLAESIPSWSSTLDRSLLKDIPRTSKSLARVLSLDAREIQARARSGRRSEWLKRQMNLEETEALRALKNPAVGIVPDEKRIHPNGDLALPVLGSVGVDGKGLSGLESEFNRVLSGYSRSVGVTLDVARNPILLDGTPKAPAAPPDIRLSIDRRMQFFAEAAIREAVEKHSAKQGLALVQDPRSGEILAMAGYPADPLKNPSVQEVYEPGSTFKIVVAAAALESGELASSERVDCEHGRWQITPSVTVKDHEPLGEASLPEIIAKSSNIGSGKIALRLGAKTFLRFCRLFGFGYKTGIPLPGESAGLLAIPGGEENSRSKDSVRLANAAFGQGIAVTPLQLLAAFSAVANGGDLLEPRLVLQRGAEAAPPPLRLRRVFGEATAKALRQMLELVVEDGTGLTAKIPGYRVAGKTGTAQKLDPRTGRYSPIDYVSSFAGFAPSEDPAFTILVIVDSPRGKHYGSEVAAPVFARLARQLLAIRGVPAGIATAHAAPSPAPAAPPALEAAAPIPVPPVREKRPPLPRPSLLKGTG